MGSLARDSNYVITKSTKSRCPDCNCIVYLLSDDKYDSPSFFICSCCNSVWEIGVGECSKKGFLN